MAETKSGAQTRNDMQSISTAGTDENYRALMATQAAGNIVATASTISEANKPGNGGFLNYMERSSRDKVGNAISTLDGKVKGEMSDHTGSLTTDGAAAVEGEATKKQKKQKN